MLKILGRTTSINVRKVLWTCREIGVPFEQEPWGDSARPTRVPEFLALNPNAQVPVIVDEAGVLWESNTICRYLAAKHGAADLLPAEPRARAAVEQWMDWQATDYTASWSYAFHGLVRRNPARQDPERIAESVREWNWMTGILNGRLAATGAYVAGEAFTLADIVVGLSVNRWMLTPLERPDYPALLAYYERLSERPGFQDYARSGIA